MESNVEFRSLKNTQIAVENTSNSFSWTNKYSSFCTCQNNWHAEIYNTWVTTNNRESEAECHLQLVQNFEILKKNNQTERQTDILTLIPFFIDH